MLDSVTNAPTLLVELISDSRLQEILGLSRKTLWRLRKRRRNPLPYMMLGGQIRYSRDEIERWIEHCKVKA